MSLNGVQKLKEAFSKERRRQQIRKKLAQKRKQLSSQLVEKEKQNFYSIVPTINHENYEENRLLLKNYAVYSEYSYEMLPISFIAYEYLLVNPLDIPSWQILVSLSYYEDFQIPQIQRFAQIIVELLSLNPQIASQFLINISSNSLDYKGLSKCSLLCCRLIDEGIISIVSQILQKNIEAYWNNSLQNSSFVKQENLQILIFNLLTSLSNIFTLKPMLQINQMEKICNILNFQTKSNKFLKQIHDQTIFRLIQNVSSEFSCERNAVELLTEKFSQTIDNCFFTYEQQSLTLMNLCVKNKVKLNEKLTQNLLITIKSKNNQNKLLALQLLQKILMPYQNKQKMEIQSPKQNSEQFLQLNSLPSFQHFTSMFSESNKKNQLKENFIQQRINTIITYSILFNENYQNTFQTLLVIFQNSGQTIQQEIVILIKAIVRSLLRQVHDYGPKILTYNDQNYCIPQMEEFLFMTVQKQEIYIFLNECLKSQKTEIILSSLQILKELLIEFKQYRNEHEEMDNEIGFEFLLNQLHKFHIQTSLNTLLDKNNTEIAQLSECILHLMGQHL